MADNIPFRPPANNGFQTDGAQSEILALGQTGELIRLPEVLNKVYRIKLLCTKSAITQSGISLETNGEIIQAASILSDSQPMAAPGSNSFAVSQSHPVAINAATETANVYDVIECKSFAVIKDAGNTAQDIAIAYEIGEYK